MWRIVAYVKIPLFVSVIAAGVVVLTTPVSAQNTMLDVQVCGPLAISRLNITEPLSDTVLRESPLTVEGETDLINQVEVYVNSTYYKVVAIPRGETKFTTDLTLSTGTHTIEVRGIGVCDGEELSDEIVVTYDPPETPNPSPPAKPSSGAKTPTVTNPNPTPQPGGGVVVSNPNPVDDDETVDKGEGWLRNLWKSIGGDDLSRWIIQVTDLDATTERLSAEWTRVAALTVGSAMVVGAAVGVGPIASLRKGYRVAIVVGGFVLLLASVLVFL